MAKKKTRTMKMFDSIRDGNNQSKGFQTNAAVPTAARHEAQIFHSQSSMAACQGSAVPFGHHSKDHHGDAPLRL